MTVTCSFCMPTGKLPKLLGHSISVFKIELQRGQETGGTRGTPHQQTSAVEPARVLTTPHLQCTKGGGREIPD